MYLSVSRNSHENKCSITQNYNIFLGRGGGLYFSLGTCSSTLKLGIFFIHSGGLYLRYIICTCCTWRNKPRRYCCRWRPGNVRGGVVPRPANEGGRTAGPGLYGGGLLCGSRRRAAGRVHLRTYGRCESGGRHGSGVCRNP